MLRVLLYEPLNEVHLLQSQLDRVEMLRLARHVSRPKLTADHPLTKPDQIRLAPGALAPWRDLPQVLLEIEVGQLVVNEVLMFQGRSLWPSIKGTSERTCRTVSNLSLGDVRCAVSPSAGLGPTLPTQLPIDSTITLAVQTPL